MKLGRLDRARLDIMFESWLKSIGVSMSRRCRTANPVEARQ